MTAGFPFEAQGCEEEKLSVAKIMGVVFSCSFEGPSDHASQTAFHHSHSKNRTNLPLQSAASLEKTFSRLGAR